MKNNQKIVVATVLFFLICAGYLSWMGQQQADFGLDKNWWSLSFDNPKSNDLSFTIENYSEKTSFHWIVFTAGKTKLYEGDIIIEKNGSEKIDLNNREIKNTKRITINVSDGENKKEIYKNFNK